MALIPESKRNYAHAPRCPSFENKNAYECICSFRSVVVEYADGSPSMVYQGIDRFEFISGGTFAHVVAPGVLYLNLDKVRCVHVEAGQ